MEPTADMVPRIWPDASTTGVPAGTVLQPSGSISVTVSGTVINGLDINGCVDIHANNVVIENTRIRCGRDTLVVRVFSGSTNLTVKDTELDGQNTAGACIGFDNFTMLRDDLHNCVDGVNANGNVAMEYTYVHLLSRGSATHNDTFQTIGGAHMLLIGNNMEAYNTTTNDLMNSAIQTGHLNKALSDVLVVGNLFDGGNYTVNAGAASTNGYSISGYVFSGNRFGTHSRYGPISELGTGISFDQTNVWAGTTTAVH
jgi:hypothetical protein